MLAIVHAYAQLKDVVNIILPTICPNEKICPTEENELLDVHSIVLTRHPSLHSTGNRAAWCSESSLAWLGLTHHNARNGRLQ
jgi:hypothetical protein